MRRFALSCIFGSAALFAPFVSADVKPNNLFSDHAVLQSGVSVPVWGTASPGEQVTVSLGDQKQTAAADADGKWMVHYSRAGRWR
jgi:sialate O-acetylesterase